MTEAGVVKLKADLEWQKRPTSRCPERKGDNADLQSMLADAERRLKDTAQKCQDPITGLQKSMVEGNATLTQTREEDVRVVATLQGELRAETGRATACETKNAELRCDARSDQTPQREPGYLGKIPSG